MQHVHVWFNKIDNNLKSYVDYTHDIIQVKEAMTRYVWRVFGQVQKNVNQYLNLNRFMLVNFISGDHYKILEIKYVFFILPFWCLFLIIQSIPKFDRHIIQVWTDYLTKNWIQHMYIAMIWIKKQKDICHNIT